MKSLLGLIVTLFFASGASAVTAGNAEKSDLDRMVDGSAVEAAETQKSIQRIVASDEPAMVITAKDPSRVSNPIRMNPFLSDDELSFKPDPAH